MLSKTLLAMTAIFAAVCPAAGASAEKPAHSSMANSDDALDRTLIKTMDEAGIAGIGAAIIVDRKLAWMKGYGFADVARAVPFTPDTVMNIGSISKTFTGVAMLRAIEQGKLSLDQDINAYLPFKVINPHFPAEKITLRQLATHTSGITDRWAVYRNTYRYYGQAPQPLAEFLQSYFVPGGSAYSPDNFLKFKPGTHREYSNIAAGLAGYIVEAVTGQTLGAYARREIFAPLGMTNSGWSLAEVAESKHSRLYVAQDGLTIPIPLYEMTTYPDGGVRTSVADLARFFIALLNDGKFEQTRILKQESTAEMLRFEFSETSKPDNVDLREINSGLFWATKFNVTRIGHNGSDPGLKTDMLSNLSKDVAVILFANTSLSGEEMRHHAAIFLELWKHAETIKKMQSMQK